MKYYIAAGFLSLLFIMIQSCKKDYVKCLECDKCKDFPKPKDGAVGIVTIKSLQRKAPCFNPNNESEFIYIKDENGKHSLVKFNMNTRLETILLSNTIIIGQPKWAKNGWIVFSKSDLQVYLIKDNGDSIKKITSYYENTHPSFLGEDKIFFSVGAETSPGASGNKVIDYFGNRLDSLKSSDLGYSIGKNSINNRNEIVGMASKNPGSNYVTIAYFNMENKNIHHIYEFEWSGRKDISGFCWHPNNDEIYFSTYNEGLYKIDKNSKKLYKIRNGCDSRSYRYLSISPDWQHILVERVDATDFNNKLGNRTEESNIYYLTINGEYETKVF